MMDIVDLKGRIDFLALVSQDTNLTERARSHGLEELHGRCPLPGCPSQKNGFWIVPETGRFMCRKCGRFGDVIDYVMARDRIDWKAAVEYLASLAGLSGEELRQTAPRRQKPTPPAMPAYAPQGAEWQAQARQAIEASRRALWETPAGAHALEYLHARGLRDETIKYFKLGVSTGRKFGELYVPAGIVIPCVARSGPVEVKDGEANRGEVWYLKIAYLPGQKLNKCPKCKHPGSQARVPCPNCGEVAKYGGVKGNRPAAIFNSDDARGNTWALFVEGEFDCMLARQEIGDVIPVLTVGGSASNELDPLRWGSTLAEIKNFSLACYDNDDAGQKGFERLRALLPGLHQAVLPGPSKDITDFVLAGGNLWQWIRPRLAEIGLYDALEVPYTEAPKDGQSEAF